MDIPNNKNNFTPPFEGFSLEKSMSFSEENDTHCTSESEFEGHSVEAASLENEPLRQKHVKQIYSADDWSAMNPEPEQCFDLHKGRGVMKRQPAAYPLERKPFVFEKDGKLISSSDHIEAINNKNA